MTGSGFLRRLKKGGSLVRVLLLALALQILVPALGMLPAHAAVPNAEAVTVCTAHGVVTLVPDGDGGWTATAAPKQAGLACAFCLPLLSGTVAPMGEVALPLPVVVEHARLETALVLALPPALPPGSSTPRAPPALH
ncbi:MAG: DUF2946 family protein [Bacteroidota bacterium]